MSPRRALTVAFLVATISVNGPVQTARAEDVGHCLEGLTDAEVAARYERIERGFARTRSISQLWYLTWLGSFAALTAAQLWLVATTDSPPVRTAYIFGSVGSTAGTLQLLVSPFAPAFAWRHLRRLPHGTPAERRARLAEAERLLEQSARHERRMKSPYRHAAAVAYPLVTAGYLYLRYRDQQVDRFGGIRLLLWGNLIGGFAIPELQGFTAPDTEIALWEDYQYGSRPCMAPVLRRDPPTEVSFAPVAFGLGLRVQF